MNVEVKENEIIYKKGELSSSFFYILNGSVNLIDDIDNKKIVYKHISKKHFFSVEDFFVNKDRSFTAISNTNTELIIIDKNNLEEFIAYNTFKIFDLLKDLAFKLKVSNEDLVTNSSKNFFNKDRKFKIIEEDNKFLINTNRKYYKKLPKEHMKYLFVKEVSCPVCNEKFSVNQIRHSKLELKYILKDDRRIYKDFDELWYNIWRCPNCNYANFQSRFYKINNKVVAKLREELVPPKSIDEVKLLKTSINDVFKDYFYFNSIVDKVTDSKFIRARIWQSLLWLLEDVDDVNMANEVKKVLRLYYEDAWYNSNEYLSHDDEVKLIIKISYLLLSEGEIRKAREYLLIGTRIRKANKVLKKKLNEMLLDIKEKYIENKNKI